MQHKIIPNLWFDTEAEEAAGFYTSVFKNARIVNVTHYGAVGAAVAVLAGLSMMVPVSTSLRL